MVTYPMSVVGTVPDRVSRGQTITGALELDRQNTLDDNPVLVARMVEDLLGTRCSGRVVVNNHLDIQVVVDDREPTRHALWSLDRDLIGQPSDRIRNSTVKLEEDGHMNSEYRRESDEAADRGTGTASFDHAEHGGAQARLPGQLLQSKTALSAQHSKRHTQ